MPEVVVRKIIAGFRYKYSGVTGKIGETIIYFADGTSLRVDEHWVLQLGSTYRIVHDGEDPAIISAVSLVSSM